MNLQEFERRLATSGLATHAEIVKLREEWHRGVSEQNEESAAQDFGKHLVQTRRATMFQVSAIFSGRPPRLLMGDYELLEKLATGGMGDVYKAVERKSGAIAVVKVLPAASAGDVELLQRFQREVKLLSEVQHPNVVGAFDAGEAEGCHFLAMEFVDGLDLGRMVKLRGPMTPEDAVECVRQAAVGLAYAHECGVVHRDVKPSNLMLDHQGAVKILDLGLARILHNDEGLTSTGSVLGSIDYMAPEQGNDSKAADHRADIYALGCTLFYLLTGRIVFDAKNISQKLIAHQDAPPPSLDSVCPTIPRKLDQLYLKMLAKDPKDRPSHMKDVVASLKKIQRDLPTPDLSKYVRGSSNNVKKGERPASVFGATLKPEVKRPTVIPPLNVRGKAMTTRARGRGVPQWRVWAGGFSAAALLTSMLGWLLWSGG
jgi:eukaryotic-like serine/threonine-protein kinase